MPHIDPSWIPDEDPTILQYERNFVAGDLICGIGYGIQILMYAACMRDLYFRFRSESQSSGSGSKSFWLWPWQWDWHISSWSKPRKTSLFLMSFITLLFSVETIFVAVQANTVQIMYVDYRNYPGGPWEFFLATQNWAVNVMFLATLFVMTFLCDLLVLWRCWIIWTASGPWISSLICLLPLLALLASFAVGTLWTLQSSQPGLSFYSALPLAFGTSYYSISLGVNILLTILITIRLLMYRREILKTSTLPPEFAKHYTSIATIIIESAAMYSLFALLFLITYGLNNPANQILLGIASAAQQVATYLIILRLATGRAWKRDTMRRGQGTTPGSGWRGPMADSGRYDGRGGTLTTMNFNNHGNKTETVTRHDEEVILPGKDKDDVDLEKVPMTQSSSASVS